MYAEKNPTEEQVKAWKKEYPEIGKMLVEVEGETLEIYYKKKWKGKVVMMDLAYKELAAKKSVIDFQRIVLENVILNKNASELLLDDDIFLALADKVDAIVKSASATFAKI